MSITRFVNPRLRERVLRGDRPQWLLNHIRRDYIEAVCVSAPPWVQGPWFRALIQQRDHARMKTKQTGIMHVMAHIVPVTHPQVCGLTVPWNIEIKTWRQNLSEGNRWSDGHCEQLVLNLSAGDNGA